LSIKYSPMPECFPKCSHSYMVETDW